MKRTIRKRGEREGAIIPLNPLRGYRDPLALVFTSTPLEVMHDHVHVFLPALPKVAPAVIAKVLKGSTARPLFMLKYKGEQAVTVVRDDVDEKYTSIICHACGKVMGSNRKYRGLYQCSCGWMAQADVNGVLNIFERAYQVSPVNKMALQALKAHLKHSSK